MSEAARLSIPSNTANIKHAIALLESLTEDMAFCDRDKTMLSVSLEEALLNTFKNSIIADESVMVDVSFFADDKTFEISIINTGVPYVMSEDEYDLSAPDLSDDALSRFLMRKTVDNMVYRNMGRNGQEIRLIKNLEELKEYPSLPQADSETVTAVPETYIRTINPEEVIEITRCVYDEYKYSYSNEDIYYPERVVGMLADKKLFSFVTVTDTGEIAGHTALKFCPEYPALMDTAIWVVKKKYRGFSVMKTLLPHALDYAKTLDINGVFVEAVTHHPATQKVTKRYGFFATGYYLLHTSPNTVVNYETDGGRRSLAIGYKAYKEIPEVHLFVPEVHREHIAEIYGRIGTTAHFAEPAQNLDLKEKSELTVNQTMWNLFASIDVDVCGADLVHALLSEVKRLKQNGIQVVMIRANMDDEYCPYIYDCALQCGFFYNGFVPHSGKGNLMMLGNLMGNAVKYENTVTFEDYAEVLEYIRKFDPNEIMTQ